MGLGKDYLIEITDAQVIISELIASVNKLMSRSFLEKDISRYDRFIKFLKLLLFDFTLAKDEINLQLLNFFNNCIVPLQLDIDAFIKNAQTDTSKNSLFDRFEFAISSYRGSGIDENSKKAVNSLSYYETKITELVNKEAKLREELKITEGKSQEEINKAKFEVEEANRKISEYKNELEFKKQQEDAREDWKDNINKTFEELKKYLKPIRNEQERLNVLFWVYLVLSVLSVVVIVVIERVAVGKIVSLVGFPDFKQYITIYLPLPIAAALLLAFIYQMNRAQRQLIVISKSIHKVEYIQGLLLSINKLAPTIEDGRARINVAIDKLITNHLGEKEIETEEGLVKEERKDSLPIDTVLKLLKEFKVIAKKE